MSSLMQAYQDYLKTSLYNITRIGSSNLCIYDPESKNREFKILENSVQVDFYTCIAQLPNGKLFCFGDFPVSGITLLIDLNYEVQQLPSGTRCFNSSAIYFNNNVYCFGGRDENLIVTTLSARFDLDKNRWIKLAPMPKPDWYCNNAIFHGDILISGRINRNLLLYSIYIDSFSIIPYEFEEYKTKIIAKADERLYLIECPDGLIYESEIERFTSWRPIGDSIINIDPHQVYCSHNKGAVYMGFID